MHTLLHWRNKSCACASVTVSTRWHTRGDQQGVCGTPLYPHDVSHIWQGLLLTRDGVGTLV